MPFLHMPKLLTFSRLEVKCAYCAVTTHTAMAMNLNNKPGIYTTCSYYDGTIIKAINVQILH